MQEMWSNYGDCVEISKFPKIAKGTFNSADHSIQLSRGLLLNKAATLRVLIHEAAHIAGRDGSKEHEGAIGNLTEKLFEHFLGYMKQ